MTALGIILIVLFFLFLFKEFFLCAVKGILFIVEKTLLLVAFLLNMLVSFFPERPKEKLTK